MDGGIDGLVGEWMRSILWQPLCSVLLQRKRSLLYCPVTSQLFWVEGSPKKFSLKDREIRNSEEGRYSLEGVSLVMLKPEGAGTSKSRIGFLVNPIESTGSQGFQMLSGATQASLQSILV